MTKKILMTGVFVILTITPAMAQNKTTKEMGLCPVYVKLVKSYEALLPSVKKLAATDGGIRLNELKKTIKSVKDKNPSCF